MGEERGGRAGEKRHPVVTAIGGLVFVAVGYESILVPFSAFRVKSYSYLEF